MGIWLALSHISRQSGMRAKRRKGANSSIGRDWGFTLGITIFMLSRNLEHPCRYAASFPFSPDKLETTMAEVKSGDTVQIHYTGTLQDGTTFDSSEGRDPLEFVVGSGQIIPGLDSALPGMTEGDKKVVQVPSEEAYGPVNPEMRQSVPREGIPADIPLDPGTQLQMQTPEGQALPVTVVEVDETTVTLDANHPLAGKDLQFDIELVKIA
jgi:peptidylprolyl isomerase